MCEFYVDVCFCLDIHLKEQVLCHKVTYFEEQWNHFPEQLHYFLFQSAMYEGFNFFIISPLVNICPFDYSQSNECECYLFVVLICMSLISRDIEHFFICFWPCVHLLWRTVYSDPAMFWMFVSPQNAYVEKLIPNVLGGEPLRGNKVMRKESLWMVSTLSKKRHHGDPSPCLPYADITGSLQSWSGSSTDHASTLVLDFQPPELFMSYPVCSILL